MSLSFKISNGDVTHSAANGRPILTTGGKKVRQDLQEFFTIFVQPNGFGAGIEELVGVLDSSQEAFQGLVYKQISDGLNAYLELQASESRITRSSEERLVAFTNLRVEKDSGDFTRFNFSVNAVTESGIQLPFTSLLIVQD